MPFNVATAQKGEATYKFLQPLDNYNPLRVSGGSQGGLVEANLRKFYISLVNNEWVFIPQWLGYLSGTLQFYTFR